MNKVPGPITPPSDERSRRWLSLTPEQRLDLALALIRRPDRYKDGMSVLARLFPDAPESMRSTAAFHLYSEAAPATVDFLAQVELSLREPDPYFSAGMAVDLLYHLYNFLQFGVLVPRGVPDLVDLVAEVRECVDAGDKEGALANIEELRQKLEACASPPDIEP